MPRKQKLITATVILACGMALALMFRKHDGGQTIAAVENQEPGLPLHADADRIAYVAAPGEETTAPPAPKGKASEPAKPKLPPINVADIERPGTSAAPPTIAEKYERQLFKLADVRPVESAPVSRRPPVAETTTPRLRKHRINDGDTLETLARRYLGDATRWGEIFEANRSTLGDPSQLPIGASLTIPPREKMDVAWPAIRQQRRPQMSIMAPVTRQHGQVSHSYP